MTPFCQCRSLQQHAADLVRCPQRGAANRSVTHLLEETSSSRKLKIASPPAQPWLVRAEVREVWHRSKGLHFHHEIHLAVTVRWITRREGGRERESQTRSSPARSPRRRNGTKKAKRHFSIQIIFKCWLESSEARQIWESQSLEGTTSLLSVNTFRSRTD